MIIIDETYLSENSVLIQIEGKLDRESVGSLHDLCQEHFLRESRVRLNLEKLLWVDKEGLDYLRSIRNKVHLEGLNSYFELELFDSHSTSKDV